jgi:hypothetical protein
LPSKRLHTIVLVFKPEAKHEPQRVPFPALYLQVASSA